MIIVTAAELVAHLVRRGVVLHSVGDRIQYRATRGPLTPDLFEELRRLKPQVLVLLRPARRKLLHFHPRRGPEVVEPW